MCAKKVVQYGNDFSCITRGLRAAFISGFENKTFFVKDVKKKQEVLKTLEEPSIPRYFNS